MESLQSKLTGDDVMTELKREDLYDTKWDVSDWSEEQKVWWQTACFDLGISWSVGYEELTILHLDRDYYVVSEWSSGQEITWCADLEYFQGHHGEDKQFSDMFPNHEAQKPINVIGSVFNNPRWVTVKTSYTDSMGSTKLTKDKDYKVQKVKTYSEVDFYEIINDIGEVVPYNSNMFHKVTKQDVLPSQKEECSDEDERGFEGLVYVNPKAYTPNIAKHCLSEDQLNFIIDKFGDLDGGGA